MAGIVRQEWLDQNAGRAYPFQENMARVPTDTYGNPLLSAALPNYVVVDMVMTLPGIGQPRMYLGQFTYVGSLLTLVFKDTVADTVVTSAAVDLRSHRANTAYPLTGVGDWEDAQGWLVIGDCERLQQDLPEGLYSFGADQTLLETRVVRPALRGVRSICCQSNGNTSAKIYDHVRLLAGENIRFEYDALNNGIWVHAEPNAGYKEECPCDNSDNPCVQTVNGISVGDVVIIGDGECVTVQTEGNKIVISDSCSKPCCGCPELDYLNTTTKVIESSMARLEAYSERLAERIATFITNFVLSVGV